MWRVSPAANTVSLLQVVTVRGSASNQLYPEGLFVDPAGNIYIVDVDNSRVQKWASGATSGVTVAGGNGAGPRLDQLDHPTGLAVDTNGDLYVVDTRNNRVQKWTPGASRGITVAGGNGQGDARNQFFFPTRIALFNGDLYIGDRENNRVQKWAPGGSFGVTVAGGNGVGTAANQLHGVYGLALDKEGNLYVLDDGNNRVQKWAPGATSGTTVIGWTASGNPATTFRGPSCISIDNNDTLYVGDYGNENVMKYAPGSSIGVLVAGGNGAGDAPNQFAEPQCSFIDNMGNLYVSDAFNYRVQKWPLRIINRNDTPIASGTYTAVVETNSGCMITTNSQIVRIPPPVKISTDSASICSGASISFHAEIPIDSTASLYIWKIDGSETGMNGADFTDLLPNNGDTITCDISIENACGISTSNSIMITVYARPTIDVGQTYVTAAGQGIQLNPAITGNIQSYTWTPGHTLSDSTISNPIAKPIRNTDYILDVISREGCAAIQKIPVLIATPIKIPNAFTPNGDGENDVFNILGGTGSRIDQFSIYDRWGQLVFEEKNKMPGNNGGWDGNLNGKPAPPGTYVYFVKVTSLEGTKQVYRGSVVLIR